MQKKQLTKFHIHSDFKKKRKIPNKIDIEGTKHNNLTQAGLSWGLRQ